VAEVIASGATIADRCGLPAYDRIEELLSAWSEAIDIRDKPVEAEDETDEVSSVCCDLTIDFLSFAFLLRFTASTDGLEGNEGNPMSFA